MVVLMCFMYLLLKIQKQYLKNLEERDNVYISNHTELRNEFYTQNNYYGLEGGIGKKKKISHQQSLLGDDYYE